MTQQPLTTGESASSDAQPTAWYAVSTRPRHERLVQQQLAGKHVESFLPTISRLSQWKDRKKWIAWPLFPGYCFARFAPGRALPILNCAGVVRIVSFAGAPAVLPEEEVDTIRRLVSSSLPYDAHAAVHEGAMMEVVRGPLRGVTGRLLRKDLMHATIVLSVDLIAQGVRVEVAATDVRPR